MSEAYDGEGDVEVTVTMLNINYSRNKKLMDSCKPLYEYCGLSTEYGKIVAIIWKKP